MVISILDYFNGEVVIINCVHIEDSIDLVEDYLESLGYNLSEISYMTSDNSVVRIVTPTTTKELE